MATSESDDFESADEEMNHDIPSKRTFQRPQWTSPTTIDSESDDDAECIPRLPNRNIIYAKREEKYRPVTDTLTDEKRPDKDISSKDMHNYEKDETSVISDVDRTSEGINENIQIHKLGRSKYLQADTGNVHLNMEDSSRNSNLDKNEDKVSFEKNINVDSHTGTVMSKLNEKAADHKRKKLGIKKLGTKITSSSNLMDDACNVTAYVDKGNISIAEESTLPNTFSIKDEIIESEMPEELKSDKKFKEVFKPEGWEGLGSEIELPEELTEEKLQPILNRLSLAGQEMENPSTGWGWANWGVSSLINTASAGVSTLTSHVSHGLTLLEESMAIPEEQKFITNEEEDRTIIGGTILHAKESPQEQPTFGFGNLISGVSSITKLVESTGNRVMSGGLDTLEAIGKKTMAVLQEGDPGLKKKRAFFTNETDKPNLSQILREAKEKAETIEKTIEETQKLRKVHFESLFDDYQGLVHLEALEMLSKQSNIKIQQHMTSIDENELNSVKNMLEEVEELCELGEGGEEVNEDEIQEKDLKCRLQEACNDLGVTITYEQLHIIYEESKIYINSPVTHNDQEAFEHAISVLAQFTAFSMERFHKTAELLLIKDHRSTVNEADSLVQLTNILSKQIGILADTYCNFLNTCIEVSNKSDSINANITSIFMEAANASSYIQDAFKLLIPIIQVGAI